MPMPSSSSATIANCACCAAGSVGSSATSAARSPDGPSSRRYSKRRSRALRRSDRNSSASVDGSSIPSTPPRSNASSMKGCGSPGCRRAEVRSGSIASFWSSADYFRSSPGNGHPQSRSPCLKGAHTRTWGQAHKGKLALPHRAD